MKLIATADLHYDIVRSRQPTLDLAEEICALQADGLLVLGDAAGRDLGILNECLHLFDRFEGRKFFVAGNHDIWTTPDGNSLKRLEEELPATCREAGFHALDVAPARLDGVGLVGSIGWYDFSYRPVHLGIPLRFYEAKIAPGAAERLPGYAHLLEDRSDIPDEAFSLGTRWMDGQHTRLPMDDVAFCEYLLARFEQHLAEVSAQCERIVVGLHHLPFAEMVPVPRAPRWAFAAAFLGSPRFGEVLLRYPQIRYALCGHSHRPERARFDHVECINVGCTYLEKRYDIVEL